MGHSPQDHCAGMHWDPGEGSYNARCNLVTSAQLSGIWESQGHEPGPHVKCGKLLIPHKYAGRHRRESAMLTVCLAMQ